MPSLGLASFTDGAVSVERGGGDSFGGTQLAAVQLCESLTGAVSAMGLRVGLSPQSQIAIE